MHLLIDYYESIGVHISQRQFENKSIPIEPSIPRWIRIKRLFKRLISQSRPVEICVLDQTEELQLESAECQ